MNGISEFGHMELKEWYKATVLPGILKKFGEKCDNVTLEIKVPTNAFFISSVHFVNVIFKNGESFSTFVKKPIHFSSCEVDAHQSELFHNEILFYREIASTSKRFPKCIYISKDVIDLDKVAIVTENIQSLGYKMCPKSYNIPYNYVTSGIREIAKFHAMGYLMKVHDSAKFSKVVNQIQESKYFRGDWQELIINIMAIRPINYLKKNKYDPNFCSKMEGHLRNAFDNVMLDAVKPCEPLAVLCHGDFTRNNIFYRQSKDTLESMLIDFATMRYASPAIDLSTFLYVSCSADDIFNNFDHIFNTYHETLIRTLKDGGLNDLDAYSYDKILADYQRRALFGYVIDIFFTPAQRGLIQMDFSDLSLAAIKKLAESACDVGGDELSKEFADKLINLRESGCLDHIIL